MKREVVNNPLKLVNGAYEMDFEQLESVIDEQCKVLILCNPHNPGGIVWKRYTGQAGGYLCKTQYTGYFRRDTCGNGLSAVYSSSVCHRIRSCRQLRYYFHGSEQETFNIAGIVTSYSIVPNERYGKNFMNSWKPASWATGRSLLIRQPKRPIHMVPNGYSKCGCM